MKVKIRGLVFVGFAAAVFAQSAMANATTDAKTVTSKLYVDNKIVATDANNGNATTITASSPDDKAPSALNVYKFVTGQVEGAAITPAVGSEAANYVNFTKSGNTLTVNFDQAVARTNGGITGTLTETSGSTPGTEDALVTAGAVKSLIDMGLSDAANAENDTTMPTSLAVVSYAEKKANKATAIIPTGQTGANSTSNTAYPTTKAVYDFVTSQVGNAAYQPKDDTQATTTTVRVGYNSNGSTPGWGNLTGATNGYVAISGSGADYTVDIPSAKIATHGATVTGDNGYNNDITSGAPTLATAGAVYEYVQDHIKTTSEATIANSTSDDANVPTMKNVYDFVSGGYQAKAAANTSTVQVGYNGGWASLAGDGTYISVSPNSGSPTVSLGNMTTASSDFVAAGDTNAGTKRPMLAKAGDVYDFVTAQLGGLAIPAPSAECSGENLDNVNDGGCALVMAFDSTANAVTLKWTKMAQ